MDQVSSFIPAILLAYLTYVIATVSPGPANIAIMATSIQSGRRSGLFMALGVVTGSICWALLAAAGFYRLMHSYGAALIVLKIIGAMYLLWLAYKALRSAMSVHDLRLSGAADVKTDSACSMYLRGLAIHLTNPKGAFGWIAVIAVGVHPGAPAWVPFLIVAGCGILGLLIFGGCAVLFSGRRMVRIYGSSRRAIEGAMAAFFCVAGIKLLATRIQ